MTIAPNRCNRSICAYQCSNAASLTDSTVGSDIHHMDHPNGHMKYRWVVSSVCFLKRSRKSL
ncbi:hypothetical protein [Microcoleus sp. K4-C2]|uniref:hypothetical protein n=1 Tax=Microcoleus sp. K4-C2 TaxID=2818792 RepID=UPI002FD5159D